MNFEIQSTFKLLKWREKIPHLLVEATQATYRNYFKRSKKSWSITKSQLAYFEQNTLGYHLYEFLEVHQIDMMPQFESHDIFHILTNYSIDSIEEIKLQYFLLGNGKRSIFQLGTILIGTILLPEYVNAYKEAYYKGKEAYTFYNWDFQYLLKEDFNDMKKLIYHKKPDLKLFNHIHF